MARPLTSRASSISKRNSLGRRKHTTLMQQRRQAPSLLFVILFFISAHTNLAVESRSIIPRLKGIGSGSNESDYGTDIKVVVDLAFVAWSLIDIITAQAVPSDYLASERRGFASPHSQGRISFCPLRYFFTFFVLYLMRAVENVRERMSETNRILSGCNYGTTAVFVETRITYANNSNLPAGFI
jgi:hypothetical protein